MNYEEKHRGSQANLDKPGLPTGPLAPGLEGAGGDPVDKPAIEYVHTA